MRMGMRLSEVYASIQGEGPNVGRPTTFIRFGGCNLRCPGWGEGALPDGTIVRGCDTVFAVYPEWREHWEVVTPDQILAQITTKHVCITGGEPLTQSPRDMDYLVNQLWAGGCTIDLFTNGSRLLPKWTQPSHVTVIMDYKLPGSGEYGSFDGRNWELLTYKDAIKFVCKDRFDFDTALDVMSLDMTSPNFDPRVYFGVVWGELNPILLAEWIKEEAPTARLNIQTHKYIWEPEARRV